MSAKEFDLSKMPASPEVLLEQLDWALANAKAYGLPMEEINRIKRLIMNVVDACLLEGRPLISWRLEMERLQQEKKDEE